MAIAIDFEWQRDELGYDLVPTPPPDPGTLSVPVIRTRPGMSQAEKLDRFEALEARAAASKSLPGGLIKRRGGKLLTYRPFDSHDGLFRVFMGAARSRDGFLDFVQRFGPLTHAGNSIEGERVRNGLAEAIAMNELLSCSPAHRPEYLRIHGQNGLECATAVISLAVNQATNRVQLQYKVESFVAALWLELAQA